MTSPVEPLIQEGMLIRIISPNFSWLMSRSSVPFSTQMVQISKGQTLTIVGPPLKAKGFCEYPVLYNGQLMTLLEPTTNFHVLNGFVRILKDVQ